MPDDGTSNNFPDAKRYLSVKDALDAPTMRRFVRDVIGGAPAFTELCVDNRRAIAGHFDRRPTLTDTSEFDAIIAYSFDYGPYLEGMEHFDYEEQFDPAIHLPGEANAAIAQVIADLTRRRDVPVFCQLEITTALSNLTPPITVPFHRSANPTYDGRYLSSKDVARAAVRAGLLDHETIVVLAHPHHVTRCIGTTRRAIVNERRAQGIRHRGSAIIPTILTPDLTSIPYPRDGFQPWPRSAGSYHPHEIMARVASLFDGWLDFDDLDCRHFL